MSNDFDRDLKSTQRRRLLQGAAALPLASIPAWAAAQQFPNAKVNTTGKAITETEVTVGQLHSGTGTIPGGHPNSPTHGHLKFPHPDRALMRR